MDSLAQLVEDFAADPAGKGKLILSLEGESADALLAAAIPLVRDAPDSAGLDFLLERLCAAGLAFSMLADAALLTDREAITALRRFVRVEPGFERRLLQFATATEMQVSPRAVQRILNIVTAVADARTIAPLVMRLIRHTDDHVRSRATLLVGSATRNCGWAFGQLRSPEARVRANAVESVWGETSPDAKYLFRQAARDQNNRVAGNALVGLYQCGLSESVSLILAMAAAESPAARATAAWVMGKTEDPRFLPRLNRMLGDSGPGVRGGVLRALGMLRRSERATERLYVMAFPVAADKDAFTVEVRDRTQRPASDLPATAFSCWCGEELIADYDVRPLANSPGRYLLRAALPPDESARIEVRTKEALGSCSPVAISGRRDPREPELSAGH